VVEAQLHSILVYFVLASAAVTFVVLFRLDAPYGRHLATGWGPTISARVGWIVMESPAVLLFVGVYFQGRNATNLVPLVMLAMWQIHYVYRALIYPLRISTAAHRMPISIVALALAFNTLNAWINARWISHLGDYSQDWLTSTPFLAGASFFLVGWLVNHHADAVLLRLRKRNSGEYQIPHGGLYRFVSCPNYLGEILEWIGWAIATWSIAGLAFAVFTSANLIPRAIAHHRWYRNKFPDYPEGRRALVPFFV
jgi:steroid 5-alpha reductase family enzyme